MSGKDYSSSFLKSLAFTLQQEGGYTVDQGGPTNKGIEQREYNLYRLNHGLTIQDVRDMSAHEMQNIYLHNYWEPVHGFYLPFPVSTCLFDAAVNCGVERAVGFLRATLSMEVKLSEFTEDIGYAFWKDTDIRYENYLKFCIAYNSHRSAYYTFLDRLYPRDETGWQNRVTALNKFCEDNT